jgi:hypothetical protein
VRAVGLVLIDERSGQVLVLRAVVDPGGAGEGDVVAVSTLDIQRVVGVQRDDDGAVAALADEVEAVVEELPEEAGERVERGRKLFVR